MQIREIIYGKGKTCLKYITFTFVYEEGNDRVLFSYKETLVLLTTLRFSVI